MKRVHFIGIGGIGMSGLARLFVHEGWVVTGSDRSPSVVTTGLERLGVSISYEQTAENITPDIQKIVYTEAMPADHPEMVAARALGVPMQNYFTALAEVANQYYLIAIAGTHGKSTTTSMTIDVLEAAGLDPTAIVGTLRGKEKSNFRAGKSKYFIVEACEFKRDFLTFTPDVLAITNLEAEHMNYYKDLSDVQDAYRTLIGQIRPGGFLVINPKEQNVAALLPVGSDVTVLPYLEYFDPLVALRVPGVHNQQNAAVTRAIAATQAIDRAVTDQALSNFAGTWRRFEYKGETAAGAVVYDDYAHHPTEVRAAIAGAREQFPNKRLVVAFQPHLYSRTKDFYDDFVSALARADVVLIAQPYQARDEEIDETIHERMAAAVAAAGAEATAVASAPALVAAVEPYNTADALILTLGAGETNLVAESLVTKT